MPRRASFGAAPCLPRLSPCDGGFCVPDEFIASLGQSLPQGCRSIGDSEGRCLSRCLPEVADFGESLEQGACTASELCVPCFDPRSGELTGACEIACDLAEEDPYVFQDCCEGRGACVPGELAGEHADKLDASACSDEGFVCAPSEFLSGAIQAASCVAEGPVASGPGACVPECVPLVNSFGVLFGQSSCDAYQKCVPCVATVPVIGVQVSTGACDLL